MGYICAHLVRSSRDVVYDGDTLGQQRPERHWEGVGGRVGLRGQIPGEEMRQRGGGRGVKTDRTQPRRIFRFPPSAWFRFPALLA